MRKASTRYTMVYSPLVFLDFDEHGNVRDYEIQWSENCGLYINDNETGGRHLTGDFPEEVVQRVDDYLEILSLVRWFVPEPQPDEPF